MDARYCLAAGAWRAESGFVIIAFVLVTADVRANIGGLVWLAIGTAILIGLRLAGRSPELNLDA